MLNNLMARTSGASHPGNEITTNDIAVVVNSVVWKTTLGCIGV
jgi:hypothetical protein